MEFGKAYHISPFDILKQDKDEVILLINYWIERGADSPNPAPAKKKQSSPQRKRVTSKTATGGWF